MHPFSLSCARRGLAVLAAGVFLPAAGAQTLLAAAAGTIVVTASRSPQPLSSVLADLSVIDRATIERSGLGGVAELLARLPGIEIARSGGPGSNTSVYIRGGETRHTAVYIDGMRIDSQASGGVQWEQIPLDQIDRIEVLRGPAAAVYGSDAVAGVVQLFTRRGKGQPRPSAALTLGSFATRQAEVGVSGSTETLDYALSASHGQSDGFDARTEAAAGHNPDRDGWRRSAASARVGAQLDGDHRLEASLLTSRLRSGYDGYAPGADDQNHHRMDSGRLAWQGRWSDALTTRLQLGQSRSTYETQPDFYRTETTLRDASLQIEQRLPLGVASATLERREDRLHNPPTAFGAAFGGRRHQDAIGLGWRGDLGGHGLQASLRHDEDSEFGGKASGGLAWGWIFVPQWRLTAAAASSFRVPTLYQRFSEYGNPGLVPESGRNLELGLRWAQAGSELGVKLWRNRLSQLIGFGAPGACASGFGCYENVGRARLQGLTLAGHTQLAGVDLRASLDWHDPRNLDSDKQLARRARRMASLGAQTRLAGWLLGAELQAAGERWDDAANTHRLAGYGLLNLTASRPLVPGLELQARVDNLGDQDYQTAGSYATAGRSGQLALRWTLP